MHRRGRPGRQRRSTTPRRRCRRASASARPIRPSRSPRSPTSTVTHAPITVTATASSRPRRSTFSTTTPSCARRAARTARRSHSSAPERARSRADQAGRRPSTTRRRTVARSFAVTKVAQTITFAPARGRRARRTSPITVDGDRVVASRGRRSPRTTPTVCKTGGTNGARVTLVEGRHVQRSAPTSPATRPSRAAPPVTRAFSVTTPGRRRARIGLLDARRRRPRVRVRRARRTSGAPARPRSRSSARRDGTGYWIVDAAGDVRAFGRAANHGGTPALRPGELVSTISSTPTGNGYWLFTTRGRVFAYGDAHFYGDMRARHAERPDRRVGRDADRSRLLHGRLRRRRVQLRRRALPRFDGRHPPQPARSSGSRRRPTTAATGSSRPTAASSRSTHRSAARWAASSLNKPVNGLVAYGNGYLMVASDGGVFDFSEQGVRRQPRRRTRPPRRSSASPLRRLSDRGFLGSA